MVVQTPNGFNLDDSGKRIVVDPVTRIEGHMRCEVNVDEDGYIRNAVSTGTIWRGLEVILKGRDPRDAWAFIRIVYSPLDALEIARRNTDHEVVFFGLGFETTTPSTALSIQQAAREGIGNFSVFCNHITVPQPLKALLDDPDMMLDGFVGPGHVSMVIGIHPYDFIARDYGKPIVVAGFEPLDLLQSVLMVLRQIRDGRAAVENQ